MTAQMTLFVSVLLLFLFSLRSEVGDSAVLDTFAADYVGARNSYVAFGVLDGYSTSSFCYEELCRCSGLLANCSGSDLGNLTYIPKLPHSVTSLIFYCLAVKEIHNYTFFVNVTNITALALYDGLDYIAPDSFFLLPKLENLSLAYNTLLNNSALLAIFSITTLRHLDVRHNNLGPLAGDISYNHSLSNLVTINMHANHVGYCGGLNMSVFAPFANLTLLELSKNKISDILPDHMDSLETLDLTFNYLETFPNTCSRNGTPLFPGLNQLLLGYNYIYSVPRDVCLSTLQILDLSANFLLHLEETTLKLYMFPNLKILLLEFMHARIKTIREKAFRSRSLRSVSIKYNFLHFGSGSIDPGCFAGIPNLNELLLSHNDFNSVTDFKWDLMFGSLKNLQYLSIENAYISKVPAVLARLLSLRNLTLSWNAVTNIPDGVFDTQPNLTSLLINDNSISIISQSTFSPSTLKQLQHLDLSGNPLICSCDVIWFRDCLVTHPTLFRQPLSSYECGNVAANLTSFYLSEQACLMNRDTSKLLTFSVSTLISTVTLLTILYRYRWHLRLVLYEAFRGAGEARRRHLQRQDFLYDLFVSYAEPDLPWVRGRLTPQLEEGLGLRLCLHDRDFIPGRPIVGNIEESVQSSKKVLMLFSTHFARSQWCQFELTLCLSHVMEHEDALLVVLLHDVPTHDLTSAMMAVLRTTTYIEWGQHPDAVVSFWGRIRIALQEILPARRQHVRQDILR